MSPDDIKKALEEKMGSTRAIDFIWLKESLPMIESVTTMITGVIVWLLVILLGLIICFEVMYINLPVVRLSLNQHLEKDGKPSGKIGLLLKDAMRACKLSALSNGNKSTMVEYIKIKVVTLMWVGVIIALLINAGPILVRVIEIAILPMLGVIG